jgi:endonuclease YncB( thermonuclease family)
MFVNATLLPPLDAVVTKISDGDTIKVAVLGSSEEITVRFACVDTPERGQLGGSVATAYLKSVLPIGSVVQILPTGEKDRYDRLPGFVFLGTLNVNLEQVAAGHAWVYTEYLGICPQYADSLNAAQDQARLERLGLWGKESCPPWEYRVNKCMPLPDCKPVPEVRSETLF